MAQIFKFNGQILATITEANWEEIPVDSPLVGGSVFNRFRLHRWQTNVMSAADYETVRGRLGQVVNITTTDYDDPNGDYVTYYQVILDKLSGEQTGPVYVGVQAEFTVRL